MIERRGSSGEVSRGGNLAWGLGLVGILLLSGNSAAGSDLDRFGHQPNQAAIATVTPERQQAAKLNEDDDGVWNRHRLLERCLFALGRGTERDEAARAIQAADRHAWESQVTPRDDFDRFERAVWWSGLHFHRGDRSLNASELRQLVQDARWQGAVFLVVSAKTEQPWLLAEATAKAVKVIDPATMELQTRPWDQFLSEWDGHLHLIANQPIDLSPLADLPRPWTLGTMTIPHWLFHGVVISGLAFVILRWAWSGREWTWFESDSSDAGPGDPTAATFRNRNEALPIIMPGGSAPRPSPKLLQPKDQFHLAEATSLPTSLHLINHLT